MISDRKRNEILASAKTLAAADGFHALTISDLARASGFSRQTIYTLLGSREGVLTALSRQLATQDRSDPSHSAQHSEFVLAAFVAEFTAPYARDLSRLHRLQKTLATGPRVFKKSAGRSRFRRVAAARVVDLLAESRGPWAADVREQKALNLYTLTSRTFFDSLADGFVDPRKASDLVLAHTRRLFEPAP